MSKGRMLLTLSWSNRVMEFLQARAALSKQNTNNFGVSLLLYICFSFFIIYIFLQADQKQTCYQISYILAVDNIS